MYRFVNTLTLFVLFDLWWRAGTILNRLPARVPIHFDILGRPDNWGGRRMIFLLPIIATIMTIAFMLGLTQFGQITRPKELTPHERLPLSLLILTIVTGFTFINRRIADCALGITDGLGRLFLPVFLAAVLGIGAWLSSLGIRK